MAMAYDPVYRRLVTANKKPYIWHHKMVLQDKTGHQAPCVKAIYNSAFFVVVSADESAVPPSVD